MKEHKKIYELQLKYDDGILNPIYAGLSFQRAMDFIKLVSDEIHAFLSKYELFSNTWVVNGYSIQLRFEDGEYNITINNDHYHNGLEEDDDIYLYVYKAAIKCLRSAKFNPGNNLVAIISDGSVDLNSIEQHLLKIAHYIDKHYTGNSVDGARHYKYEGHTISAKPCANSRFKIYRNNQLFGYYTCYQLGVYACIIDTDKIKTP